MNIYQKLYDALLAHEPKELGTELYYYGGLPDNGPCCAIGVYEKHHKITPYDFESDLEDDIVETEITYANDSFKGTKAKRYQHMLAWSKEAAK